LNTTPFRASLTTLLMPILRNTWPHCEQTAWQMYALKAWHRNMWAVLSLEQERRATFFRFLHTEGRSSSYMLFLVICEFTRVVRRFPSLAVAAGWKSLCMMRKEISYAQKA